MKVTPNFVVSFETEIHGLVTGNWQRVQEHLMWDRLMKIRPMAGKTEILTWLLETAKIYPEGNGGNKRFDDMVAATMSLENTHAGDGLRLTRDEIEDNQMANNPSVGALDYASKWAKDIGAAASYYPQQQLFSLILAGETTSLAYDALPFFSAVHLINPAKASAGTYSNIVPSVPLRVTSGATEQDNLLLGRKNLGIALAAVRKQRFVNGVPRFLKPTTLLVQSDDYDYANLIVNGAIISQTSNEQVSKLEVVCAPELDGETTGTYYIGVEDMLSDEMGAFMWGEREPFFTRFYGPMDEAVLARMNSFEWLMDGRNVAVCGHPYLFYKCKPGA